MGKLSTLLAVPKSIFVGGAFQSTKQTDLTPAMLHDYLPPALPSGVPLSHGTYIHTKCMWPGFCLCASFAVQVNQQRRLQEAHANLAIVFGIEIGFGNEE